MDTLDIIGEVLFSAGGINWTVGVEESSCRV